MSRPRAAASVVLTLLLLAPSVFAVAWVLRERRERAELEHWLELARQSIAEREAVEAEEPLRAEVEVERQINIVVRAKSERPRPAKALAELGALIPPGFTLHSLVVDDRRLLLTGTPVTPEDYAKLVDGLREHELYRRVHAPVDVGIGTVAVTATIRAERRRLECTGMAWR